jgi:ATPase family associated with various cellular activities (AAA)
MVTRRKGKQVAAGRSTNPALVQSDEQGKPRVYVLGNSGIDKFTGEYEAPFPSGASFVHLLMRLLLEKTVDCRLLVGSAKNGQGELLPLAPKNAHLKRYGDVHRIEKYIRSSESGRGPRSAPGEGYSIEECTALKGAAERDKFLVLHWADWQHRDKHSEASLSQTCDAWFGHVLTPTLVQDRPQIFVNLSSGIPRARQGGRASEDESPFDCEVWNRLYKRRRHVAIVTCMSTLRAEGAIISRRLSFEQTVEDLCSELLRLPGLNLLARFSHLFVRIGMVGVVHVRRLSGDLSDERCEGQLFFCPYAKEGLHRNDEDEGFTLGRSTILISELVKVLLQRSEDGDVATERVEKNRIDKSFMKASKCALFAMQKMDDRGYRLPSKQEEGSSMISGALHGVVPQSEGTSSKNEFSWRRIPSYLFAQIPPRSFSIDEPWRMLDDVLLEAPVHRINIALAIVMAGHKNVLNQKWDGNGIEGAGTFQKYIWRLLTRVEYWNPHDRAPDFVTLQEDYMPAMPHRAEVRSSALKKDERVVMNSILGNVKKPFWIDVPVMNFGSLNLLERDEIESLRSIVNLFRLHRKQTERLRAAEKPLKPISIAVFGAPGTGKSFAVKQLAKSVGGTSELPLMEFNIAQFSDPSDLHRALEKVSKRSKQQKGLTVTPLVFFDEFDCPFGGRDLGWLQYFLAPMQDGKLSDGETDIGPAIFVFAGGLHSRFAQLDPRTDEAYDNLRNSEDYRSKLKRFAGQKGPDFISRLRGRIDILPINDQSGKSKHFIRRAMLLRSVLEANELVQGERDCKQALIDPAVVYALLTTDRFRHGVRSMQAIVEMCTPIHGRIEVASLPSRAQLDMHADATELMIRVHRGRERNQPDWQSESS